MEKINYVLWELNNYDKFFEQMIFEHGCGNEGDGWVKGDIISWCFEDCDRLDDDLYSEEDIKLYKNVKNFINSKGGKVGHIGHWCDEPSKYEFEVTEYGIECNWIYPGIK